MTEWGLYCGRGCFRWQPDSEKWTLGEASSTATSFPPASACYGVDLDWFGLSKGYVDIPQQYNGFDCGVFTCAFGHILAQGLPLGEENCGWGQREINNFRTRAMIRILKMSAKIDQVMQELGGWFKSPTSIATLEPEVEDSGKEGFYYVSNTPENEQEDEYILNL